MVECCVIYVSKKRCVARIMADTSVNNGNLEKLTAINERYKQEIHALKRKLEHTQVMMSEAVQQVEAVQAELSMEKARTTNLSTQHSKDTAQLNSQWMQKLEGVENNFLKEKNAYENEIMKLKDKIAEIENVSVLDSTETVMELQNLKSKNQELVGLVHGFEEKLSKEKCKILSLESLVQELSNEIEVSKCNFEQKKEELAYAQETIDNVRGETAHLKMELERMKAEDASHIKRGNSLFAEVEDRRKVLQGHLDVARAKLQKLKIAYKKKDAEISRLRADRGYLCFEFKSLEKECKRIDSQWHSTYTQRIQELEKMVNELRSAQQASHPLVVGEGSDDFKWVSRLLADKQADVRRVEAALEEKSVACLMTVDCLQQARRSLQATRAELLSAKATIMDLKMALVAADPSVDIDSEEICAAAGPTSPVSEEFQDNDKENIASADLQKFSLDERNVGGKPISASFGSVVQSASKQELNDITSAAHTAINIEEINFPVL